MKAVKRDLQSVIKELKLLTAKAEKIAASLDAGQQIEAVSGRPGKAASLPQKQRRQTAADTIMKVIKRQRHGIDTAGLEKKTKLETQTIRNAIFRLKKQGKVQATTRGLYMAV